MVNFYEDDDPEGEAPVVKTQAELTLQNLLQKQLSTAHRFYPGLNSNQFYLHNFRMKTILI
jgi:hypothetical protein